MKHIKLSLERLEELSYSGRNYSDNYESNRKIAVDVIWKDLEACDWDVQALSTKPRMLNSEGRITGLGWHGAYNYLLKRVREEQLEVMQGA